MSLPDDEGLLPMYGVSTQPSSSDCSSFSTSGDDMTAAEMHTSCSKILYNAGVQRCQVRKERDATLESARVSSDRLYIRTEILLAGA